LPWSADPRRDAEWYARTERDLGPLIMQEYPATVEEALTIPGGSYFPEFKEHIHVYRLRRLRITESTYQSTTVWICSQPYGTRLTMSATP
jgi:hypothetical protein